ncbi:MAG: transglutaminase domain-containing protein, partial [Deltaproteobacteria bacterium]|nr:transglutaminase domain-containing protein [Deltaproteobacteria bacterium]
RPGAFFLPYSYSEHLWLAFIFFAFAAASGWCFWKWRHALTIELVGMLAVGVHLLSGHRNYHFESPRILNNLAWILGVQQLWVFILTGAALTILLLLYAFLTNQPAKAAPYYEFVGFRVHRGKLGWRSGLVFVAILAAILYLICQLVFNYYNAEVMSRTANGVGQETKEGLSPLDFHSALGSTNQPAALVRLEGDYSENPSSPMLYLRESALSEFDGKQIVMAGGNYDRDVSGIDPGQSWIGHEDERLGPRVELGQSMFLLTEHKLAFAADYPISINQLKNPNTRRFKAAYRAKSLAPSYTAEQLASATVGDPLWSEEVWQHYLEQHPDPRYAEMAEKITTQTVYSAQNFRYVLSPTFEASWEGALDKWLFLAYRPATPQRSLSLKSVAPAFQISTWLSKNAIYTLTPNHDVKPEDDPVAPFLFGDKRGYCVHFAHATVYMLRALGVPSRIATGYLTDLSQSRDGHILLRMSDRHAWAEVYVNGKGWIPFDTQPEQVESHADTQVDLKLLEELMGMIGPSEDILPADIAKDEPSFKEIAPPHLPGYSVLVTAILGVLLLMISVKAYLRFGWRFASSPPTRIKLAYLSVISQLYDLGYRREHGETRTEFRRRVERSLGVNTLSLTDPLNRLNYQAAPERSEEDLPISTLHNTDTAYRSVLPIWRRFLAAASPASLMAFITRVRW